MDGQNQDGNNMASTTKNVPRINKSSSEPVDAGTNNDGLAVALQAAADQSSAAPLLAWARTTGEVAYAQGEALRELIERFLLLGQSLTVIDFTDLDEGKLPAALLASAIEGYSASATSEGDPAHKASDDTLRERVSELTALHRINSAANSSLNLGDMLNLSLIHI